ncbi:tumor necrosis factor alpha-induced protein 2-like isoform X2 [Centroberyx affinis]
MAGGKLDSPTDKRGKRFHMKLPKFRRNSNGQSGVSPPAPAVPAADALDSPPEEEPLTFEQNLEQRRLCEAGRQLIDREERLFGEIAETEPLQRHEEEERKLAADRGTLVALVEQTLKRSLSSEEGNAEALTSALKTVCQEEQQDRLWILRTRENPPWRPARWRKLHDSTLRGLVEERMESASMPGEQGQRSSVQQDVCAMGKQLKDDLLQVARGVKGCYPPELDVCNLYARLYHQAFSARLRRITEFVLEGRDCATLLHWVKDHYPRIFQNKELVLEMDYEALGALLPEELYGPLQEQHLINTQGELQTYINQALQEAEQAWKNGDELERRDGNFFSPLAFDVIQFMDGAVRSGEILLRDQGKIQTTVCLLKDFLQSFKKFHEDVMKGGGASSRPVVMANLGSVVQFRDYIIKKRDLFPEDVRENCLSALTSMEQSAHTFLLSPVHKQLKPQYRTLGTSDWLKEQVFEKLLGGLEEHIEDLQGLTESCQQKLMGQLQQEVTVEYVQRLLRGKVKLKDKELQERAARIVTEEGQRLSQLFSRAGSRENWLNNILPQIAEVLRLQNLPSMQMEVTSLGAAFPDLSDKHLSALLKLKTNLSAADRKTVKETFLDNLTETEVDAARPFFSRVQLR